MKIKEIKQYQVDERFFNTRTKAEEYLLQLENKKVLVILTGPDLTEGRYNFSKLEVFPIEIEPEDRLSIGQDPETLVKIVELVLLNKMMKYSGVMGTIQLKNNFIVKAIKYKEFEEKYAYNNNIIKRDEVIALSKIPYELNKAIIYLTNIINNK